MKKINADSRLLSLDVLRGLDLMMLVGLQPLLRVFLVELDNPLLNGTLLYQFDHAQWEGMRVWDFVMPLFLFMSGVTMPYSLPKYRTRNGDMKVWARVLKRFFVLFALGMLVQGNVLALDLDRVYLYSNTLQAIAVGYLFTVPLVLYLKPWQQVVAIAVLLLVYSVPMHLWGDWSAQGNFACIVDKAILGRFRDGSVIAPDGTVLFAAWYDYTWIWSSITFCCTVTLGSLAGHVTKNGNNDRPATARRLLLIGLMLLIAGLLSGILQPIIKRIWTASMVLYSAGWCYLLLALFYWWIDVKGHRKGWNWLLFYGCNAITAYIVGEVVNFRCIASSLFYGLEQYIGGWYPVFLTACNSLILFLLLWLMYGNKFFLKV